MKSPKSIPPHNAPRFKAGQLIHREGPKTAAELFAAIYFGKNASTARDNLRQSIGTGWLVDVAGVISCSAAATAYYKARANEIDGGKLSRLPDPEPEPTGQKVPPRVGDLLYGPELSRKYIPNRRGPRLDALDNSLATMPSFYSKALP